MVISRWTKARSASALPPDSVALRVAQLESVRRTAVPLYLACAANVWVTAVLMQHRVPPVVLLAGLVPVTAAAVVVVALRLARRAPGVTEQAVTRGLTWNRQAVLWMAVWLVGWALALYRYADLAERVYVAHFATVSLVACLVCLTYSRRSMLLAVLAPGGVAVLVLAVSGEPLLLAVGLETAFLLAAALPVAGSRERNLRRLVLAQEREGRSQRQITDLALNDPLTRLPNRYTITQALDSALDRPDPRATVLFVDLDGFKTVNDTLGHQAGDVLLAEVARRLERTARRHRVSVGRLGGDEFAVLLPHDDRARGEALGSEIVATLSEPYDLDTARTARIGASVGAALAPAHGTDGEALLARADIALYAAKDAGKGTVRVFDQEMERRLTARIDLEAALRRALADEERVFVFYQPIVDATTGRVTAREALVRWHDADRGWVPPNQFVPVAEESGLIGDLGRLVLTRACQDATTWADGARVAVNISAEQLGRGTLVGEVREALAASGLPAGRLELEITETAMFTRAEASTQELAELTALGVRVALDDFGTGYSSLSHLIAFHIDKIKIDGSFVRESSESPASATVVRALISMAREMGLTTVAECVETEQELERLRNDGCTEIQGYLYGRPEPRPQDAQYVQALNTLRPRI
ncbi:putative bifunctional diguanylate cyclase/phosphodiesterase [Xylanimonas oleitrophica]|nr:EAL domain-containing protein [Xylanimonas oleitrophica]